VLVSGEALEVVTPAELLVVTPTGGGVLTAEEVVAEGR